MADAPAPDFFDPSDPLGLLSALQPEGSPHASSSHDSSSASADSPGDWSQFSTLWDPTFGAAEHALAPQAPAKSELDPFGFTMPMELDGYDFSGAAGTLDPFALALGPQDFLDPAAFTAPQRRLSVTSNSSSSGASLSPSSPASVQYHQQPQPQPPATDDPVALLIHQAQLAAGVTLAVPTQTGKLPIPRLRPGGSPSSAPSAPTSSLPSPTPAPLLPPLVPGARTKTSHTTIERRYRTNLNTRIQALKDAVPALRVLEARKAAEKAGRAHVDDPADMLDARGFADGVRVARKISKANVLGKAAEYIRVLKRREARLAREKAALRDLLGGLVGGAALLREFEAGWAAKYGGRERDELEYEGGEDDEDEEEEDDDEDDGRARKRPRVDKKASIPAAAAAPAKASAGPAEKRKRGRPRKEPAVAAAPVAAPPAAAPAPAPGAQYLLAAFAFFSFFNVPGRQTHQPLHAHNHSGSVLTSAPAHHAAPSGLGAQFAHLDAVGAFHLLVSALVFMSILGPWLPRPQLPPIASTLRRLLARAREPAPAKAAEAEGFPARLALMAALAPAARGGPDEAAALRSALRVRAGLLGVLQRAAGKLARGRRGARGIERLQLEQRAWMRLGEVTALAPAVGWGERVQAYIGAAGHMPAFSPQAADLATLALLVRPLAHGRAEALWERAKVAREVRPAERRALERVDVHGAAVALASPRAAALAKAGASPLQALAVLAARDALRTAASALFVRAVLPHAAADDGDLRSTVQTARALGGATAQLGALLDALARGGAPPGAVADALDGEDTPEAALLGALVRLRALLPSQLAEGVVLSPAGGDEGRVREKLRRGLGHAVFEEGALEEARDCVVDLLVESEDRRKGRAV